MCRVTTPSSGRKPVRITHAMRRTLGMVSGHLSSLKMAFGQGQKHLRGRESAGHIIAWLQDRVWSVHSKRLEGNAGALYAAFVAETREATPPKFASFQVGLAIVAQHWPFLERLRRLEWRIDFPAIRALSASDPRISGFNYSPLAFIEEIR